MRRAFLAAREYYALYQNVGKAHIKFHFADLYQTAEQWLKELEVYNPTIMVGSAQALVLATQSQSLQPELVVSGAEVLSIDDRQTLQNRFACDVKEVYQCTEGFLACTHRDGAMRWNEDLVHVEPQWLDDRRTHYQPIITDFRRRSQPIIRYVMDNVVVASDMGDSVYQPLSKIAGRCGDILNINEVKVLPDLVHNAISSAIPEGIDYRISQVKKDRLIIQTEHQQELIESAVNQLLITLGVDTGFTLHYAHEDAPDWHLQNK